MKADTQIRPYDHTNDGAPHWQGHTLAPGSLLFIVRRMLDIPQRVLLHP